MKCEKGECKLKKQKSSIKIIKTPYELLEKVTKLFNDYSKITSETKYRSIYGEELNILTPKKMLQRIPIAFARVKVGNTSKNALNEIRKIIYSLYQGKGFTKKYITT